MTHRVTDGLVKLNNDMPPEPVDFETARIWALNNGVIFKTAGDLSALNKRRRDFGLPPYLLADHVFFADAAPMPDKARGTTIIPPRQTAKKEQSVTTPESKPKIIDRSLRGLSEVMFDELDKLRDGTGSVDRVRAVCDVAGRVATLLHAQIKVYQIIDKTTDKDAKSGLKAIAG